MSRKAECHQTLLAMRYSSPRPVLVLVTADPFDCAGDAMSEKGLVNFVSGASWAESNYDLSDEVFGSYTLGSHSVRIGRTEWVGTGHPEQTRTKELVCSLLRKARVFWLAVANDEASLKLFEQTAVTLDGESGPALVPAEAFAPPGVFKSDFGFTFSYPSNWEPTILSGRQPSTLESPRSMTQPRGAQCSKMELMLLRGRPVSEIDLWVSPYSCAKMTLNGFAQASVDAAKEWRTQNNLGDFDFGKYVLGGYDFWVDQAAASPNDHPEQKLALETVCGLLKTAMVCWKGRLRDEEAVKVFEGRLTSINDKAPELLVPPSAFMKKK